MKKIIVTGNVGRDPEQRTTTTGDSFVVFSLAVSSGTKAKPKTDWLKISCSSEHLINLAMQYIKKGSKLLIEGTPSVNAYINKENKAVGTLRVLANTIEFIGGKKEDDTSEGSDGSESSTYGERMGGDGEPVLTSDDVPFN